jgi:hypothetical protein
VSKQLSWLARRKSGEGRQLFKDGVEIDEEFSGGGGEGNLGGFAAGTELEVKVFEDGVMTNGDESGHPKGATDGVASAGDGTLTSQGTGIAVMRSETDQGGDFAGGAGAQLG